MPRLERFKLRRMFCEAKEGFEGLVFFNADGARKVAKPRYYVIPQDNFDAHVKEGMTEVDVQVVVEGSAMSLAQLKDSAAPIPNTPEGTYIRCVIEKTV